MKYFNTNLSLSLMIFCLLNGCATVKRASTPTTAINSGVFHTGMRDIAIRLVAPSSAIEPQELARLGAIEPINLNIPNDIFKAGIPYHAHSDEARFKHLSEAFGSEAPVIWSLRGGYGSARLFEALKTMPKPAEEKIFVGFSDATFLHLFLSQWGWKTIHGAMAFEMLNVDKNPKNFTRLFDIISGKTQVLSYGGFEALNKPAAEAKELKGPILGGNMTILTNSLGTPWQINGAAKIVFIEDVGTKGYVVDRSLNHLKQAGVFEHAVAIIFGSFTGDNFVDYALKRFAGEINIPVYKAPKFGHQNKNYPLVFNTPSIIKKDKNKENRFRLTTPLTKPLFNKKSNSYNLNAL